MNQYKNLAPSQRYPIYQALKLKMTASTIAKSIGVHQSTISYVVPVTRANSVVITSKQTYLLVQDNLCQGIKSGACEDGATSER